MAKKSNVQATLEWVNEIRASRGMRRLPRLLKGTRHNGRTCPVARSLGIVGAFVGNKTYSIDDKPSFLPPVVTRFVKAFDKGRYPEFEGAVRAS